MESYKCLNCDGVLAANFCSNCGQKATTRRFSWWHVFEKDGLGMIINMDKGIFYTAKQMLSRPGDSVREYLKGKRVNHYNYLSFLTVCLAASYFIGGFVALNFEDVLLDSGADHSAFQTWVTENPKLFLIFTIPVFALFSMLWFSKARYNISEHVVINCYRAAGEVIIGLPFIVACLLKFSTSSLSTLFYLTSLVVVAYNIFFYYQLFAPFYKQKVGLLARSIACSLSVIVLSGLVVGIAILLNEG